MSFVERPRQKARATQHATQRARAVGPVGFCLIGFVLILGALTGAGLLYWHVFRDDVLEALLRRQADMQYAYEDRLASLRAHVDRVTSRQLLDQNTIEGRVHDLLSRQAQLESRAAMIAALADHVGMGGDGASSVAQTSPAPASAARPEAPRLNPLHAGPAEPPRRAGLPSGASAYAAEPPQPAAAAPPTSAKPEPIEKPRPEGVLELRSSLDAPAPARNLIPDADAPAAVRLSAIGRGLERIERDQVQAVSRIGAAARQKATNLKTVIADVGLSPDRLALPSKAMGGPFIPLPLQADATGSVFERELGRIASDYQAVSRLTRIIPTLPLRRPLAGRQEVTSGYGMRMDPFMGRMALHSGLDLREDAGALVRATAGGKVVSAGWSGGYGNMVEVDHGNDLATRYGHLSSINVVEGQSVAPGAILGRVGSTGRSTGPHLHYEVRMDGDAVDPTRFLRASDKAAWLK